MTLAEFNIAPRYRAEAELNRCCAATVWVRTLAGRRPFQSYDRLLQAAEEVWWALDSSDWLEAFAAHPQIGQRTSDSTAAREQSGVGAATSVLAALAQANREYFDRFGYIFIVCASGKTGPEMLEILRSRLQNAPEQEIRIAAEQQRQITRLRLERTIMR